MALDNKVAQQGAVQSVQKYSGYIFLIAGIQILLPIALGIPENAVLGVILLALGFGIRRCKLWAAVALLVISVMNVLILVLGGAYGSTVLSVVIIACAIKSITAIRSMRQSSSSGNTLDMEIQDISDDEAPSLGKDRAYPRQNIQKGNGMSKTQRRIMVVVAGFVAMGVVIALGATPNQGGLLGAAIVVVFWGWGAKSDKSG